MGEIKINVSNLENNINNLKKLLETCADVDVSEEEMLGGGRSIEAIHLVDQSYSVLKESLITLITNSIGFFDNVKASLKDADDRIASNM